METSANDIIRFAALADLESNSNDNAIGKAQEISRYQMTPTTWMWATSQSLLLATNQFFALQVAKTVMASRLRHFEEVFEREPNDKEWCLLWHCPGRLCRRRLIGSESGRDSDEDYAERFQKLVDERKLNDKHEKNKSGEH